MSTKPTKKDIVLKETYKSLNTLLQNKIDALPKDFNRIRFLQNCMTVLQDTKNIENCNGLTVARTMLKGAFLGLDFFNKECYAIPYGNSLNFQTDYKGEIKLCKKYSINPIKDIYAKVVREGDEFEEIISNGQQVINFKPISFNNGEIIGAFAVALFKDGSMMYEAMSKEEIEGVRKNYSKMPNSTAWKNSTGEMYKKTVLRRLCKLIELDFDSIEQQKTFEESFDMDFKKEESSTIEISPFEETKETDKEENIKDVEYEAAEEMKQETEEDIFKDTPFGNGGEN
jgi:recombination protein RecT